MIQPTALAVIDQVRRAVVGKDAVVCKTLMAILARGHILLEDNPGVGKTTLALAFSKAMSLSYRRVQFTPDVMPSDITGYSVYQKETGTMEVLLAKIQAMLRRSYDYEIQQPLPRLRDAVLDAGGSCLIREGARIELTKNEARILQLLLEKPGQIVSREAIMLRLWDSDVFVDDNTLTVNINRLRRTLREAGLGEDCITTHKGQGYSIHG